MFTKLIICLSTVACATPMLAFDLNEWKDYTKHPQKAIEEYKEELDDVQPYTLEELSKIEDKDLANTCAKQFSNFTSSYFYNFDHGKGIRFFQLMERMQSSNTSFSANDLKKFEQGFPLMQGYDTQQMTVAFLVKQIVYKANEADRKDFLTRVFAQGMWWCCQDIIEDILQIAIDLGLVNELLQGAQAVYLEYKEKDSETLLFPEGVRELVAKWLHTHDNLSSFPDMWWTEIEYLKEAYSKNHDEPTE